MNSYRQGPTPVRCCCCQEAPVILFCCENVFRIMPTEHYTNLRPPLPKLPCHKLPPPLALVDAGVRTTVTVGANAYDDRTSGAGCSPDGCTPENTRDGSRTSNSRWSCKEDLEDENCKITYYFEEAQDIVRMRIAFHKGNENQRWLRVKLNGSTHSTIESSGETLGYQNFALNSDETEDLSLEAVSLDGDEWISIKEVRLV